MYFWTCILFLLRLGKPVLQSIMPLSKALFFQEFCGTI